MQSCSFTNTFGNTITKYTLKGILMAQSRYRSKYSELASFRQADCFTLNKTEFLKLLCAYHAHERRRSICATQHMVIVRLYNICNC